MAIHAITLVLIAATATLASGVSPSLEPQPPRYEITLTLAEFSVLNSAARLGVGKYGGTANFEITMSRGRDSEVSWTVTIRNPKLMEIMQYWMAEKTSELVNLLDFDTLDAASKSALATVKSVNAKIAEARANPIWDSVKVIGEVIEDNGNWFVDGPSGRLRVVGTNLESVNAAKGKQVVVTGYVKAKGQIELVRLVNRKEKTLELFVMSMCPYSRAVESSIIDWLAAYPGQDPPFLEIHYIFYERQKEGTTIFTSLRGEPEVTENLVQMLIRDHWPEFFHDYVLLKAESDLPWSELAQSVGLTADEVDLISERIEVERDVLIQREYDYVVGSHQIYDGSPSYVWEGERVAAIGHLEPFGGLASSGAGCFGQASERSGDTK